MVSVAGVTARWEGGVEAGLEKEQCREEGRKFGEKLGGMRSAGRCPGPAAVVVSLVCIR